METRPLILNKESHLRLAKAIGDETYEYVNWFITEYETKNLLDVSVTFIDMLDKIIDNDINVVMSGNLEPHQVDDIEALCAELNSSRNAPTIPDPDLF